MKRITLIICCCFLQLFVIAQRGRFRPEWDMNDVSRNHHSIDDDFWSFLLIIGIIILFLVFAYFKGVINRQRTEKRTNHSSFGEMYDKFEDGCGTVFGIGCLLSVTFGIVIGVMSLCTGGEKVDNKNTPKEKRKDKTIVKVIVSEDDNMQLHEASKDEFQGEDTVFYYEYYVFQNKTGRNLTEYLIKYSSDGNNTLEVLKHIKPNQYFKSTVNKPFQKPPTSINFNTTHVKFGNWKSQSRWGNKKETTKYMNFIDYSDYVSKTPMRRK